MAGKKSPAKMPDKHRPTNKEVCPCGPRRAVVMDINDPLAQGRVKIKLQDTDEEGTWARMATPMAGHNRGTWFIPDVGDEVLVVFEGGGPLLPYVIGALWSESAAPPASMDIVGSNNLKVIRSRKGLQVTLDDTDGQEKLVLETPGGQRILMIDGPGALEIADSSGNSLKLEPGGITINSQSVLRINAGAVEVSAGVLTVNAGVAKFSGVVQADAIICNSVNSASYSPGAGNIL